jgi:S1-C subfamily serine protease
MRNLALAVLALVLFAAPSHAEWPSDRMDAQIDDTNIILGMQSNPMCSGTIISVKDRLILTAAHCVTDAYSTKTVTETDPKTGEVREKTIETSKYLDVWTNKRVDSDVVSSMHYAAKPISRDAVLDVAILQVLDTDWKPKAAVPLAPKSYKIRRGQTIYIVGNPAGVLDASVSKGIISATQRKLQIAADSETPYFQTDAAAIGGNSGGGVFSDKGELIGVLSAGMRQSTITFVVPLSSVRAVLARAGFKDFE